MIKGPRKRWIITALLAICLVGCEKEAGNIPAPEDEKETATAEAPNEGGSKAPTLPVRENERTSFDPAAIIYTANIQGDPYTQGETFTIDVAVRECLDVPVSAYMFRVFYNSYYYTMDSVADVDLGGMPPIAGPAEGPWANKFSSQGGDPKSLEPAPDAQIGAKTFRDFGSMGNLGNTKLELTLCRLTFTVANAPAEPQTVTIEGDPANVPVVDAKMGKTPHAFDNSATDPLPKPGEADGGSAGAEPENIPSA